MPKVLIIGFFNFPFQQASAIYVDNLRKVLSELGFSVTILDKNRIDYKQYSESIIPVNKIENEFDEYFNYKKIQKYISSAYDLFLLYNFSSYESFRILRVSRKKGIKVGAISTEWKTWKSSNPVKAMVRGLDSFLRMRIINKCMDYNICCSRYLYDYYRTSHPYYLPTLTEKGKKRLIKSSQDRELKLVYIGMPSKDKENLGKFISALIESEMGKRCFFDLYGVSEDQYKKIFGAIYWAEAYENIRFMGKVSQAEIAKRIEEYDYSVIFRERNLVNSAGFPTKMGTSLSHGIAVLATDVGDISLYIGNGVNGFILPQKEDDLIAFLNQLPSMPYPDVDCDALYWKKYISNLSGIRESYGIHEK